MATILVIEEESQLLQLWHQALDAAGYNVYEARDIAEGLTCCQQHVIDLVMTQLPATEGEDLAMIHALRALIPPVKILVLAVGGMPRTPVRLARALQAGADVAFQKPLGVAALLRAVRELLEP